MAGTSGDLLYFKVHACLDVDMNILRRNMNTTCITSKPWRDVTAVNPINREIAELEDFEASFQ